MRLIAILVMLVAILTSRSLTAQESVQERIDQARALLEKYTETRKLISKERKEWTIGRETLRDRIGILQRDITAAQESIAEAERSLENIEANRAQLAGEMEKTGRVLEVLEEELIPLESRTRRLASMLPPQLRDKVDLFTQRIPEEGAAPKGRLSERYQNIVGILNPANKFHREITKNPEMRDLGDGRSAEVTTVYLGLSQAFFLTPDGKFAGRGTPRAGGWDWVRDDRLTEPATQVLSILSSPSTATFVPFPIRID